MRPTIPSQHHLSWCLPLKELSTSPTLRRPDFEFSSLLSCCLWLMEGNIPHSTPELYWAHRALKQHCLHLEFTKTLPKVVSLASDSNSPCCNGSKSIPVICPLGIFIFSCIALIPLQKGPSFLSTEESKEVLMNVF